jgi:hypothetical protein
VRHQENALARGTITAYPKDAGHRQLVQRLCPLKTNREHENPERCGEPG